MFKSVEAKVLSVRDIINCKYALFEINRYQVMEITCSLSFTQFHFINVVYAWERSISKNCNLHKLKDVLYFSSIPITIIDIIWLTELVSFRSKSSRMDL